MKRIRELRKEYKVTQQELADFIKVNRNAISRYESGEREPDISTLIKIANFFKVSLDYLVSNSDQKVTNPTDITMESSEIFDNLSEQGVEEVKKYAELVKLKEKNDKYGHDDTKTSSSCKKYA